MNFSHLFFMTITLLSMPAALCRNPSGDNKKATDHLIAFFDSLVLKKIIGVDNLKHICSHDCLTNPITQQEAHSSNAHYIYWSQINQLIEKHDNDLFDVDNIKEWAADKVRDIEARQAVSQEIHEITRDVHRPMQFVELPAGKYVSSLDNAEFEIPEGIEIQDTPVTQWQWIQYMENNPSRFNDGRDAERITIDDEETSIPERISILGDHPTESVSFGEMEEFIKYLNDNDPIYSYALPSVKEYEALLLASLGNRWIELLNARSSATEQQTLPVISTAYLELSQKRLWSLGCNVWEFTRDRVEYDTHAHVVFGSSFATQKSSFATITSFLRPVLYSDTFSERLGLRVIRKKKQTPIQFDSKMYDANIFMWDASTPGYDSEWYWKETENILMLRDDSLQFLVHHKENHSQDIQDTIDTIFKREMYIIKKKINCSKNTALCLKRDDSLFISDVQLKNLSPLGHLTRLKMLQVGDNEISDIRPLASLNNLESLYLGGNKISDLTPLAHLNSLKQLTLNANNISDISPLGQLPRLTTLQLASNFVKTVPKSIHFRGLKHLDLAQNELTECESVAHLSDISSLDLSGNPITDLMGLNHLVNLIGLTIQACFIKDLNPLGTLTNLKVLALDGNEISDIGALSSLANLQGVGLSSNQISDISPLARLKNLQVVRLSYNPITDISPLKQLPRLKQVRLDPEQIKDLKPREILGAHVEIIEDTNVIRRTHLRINREPGRSVTDIARLFKNLEKLELQENTIRLMSPLADFKKLEHLNLNHNAVNDISKLASLVTLKELYLENNDVADISALASLTYLTRLGLAHNKITTIEPLADLKNLESLSIHTNPLHDISDLAKIENLKEVYLDTHQIERFKPHTWLNPKVKIIHAETQRDQLEYLLENKESQAEDVQKTIDALSHLLEKEGLTAVHPRDFSLMLKERRILDLSNSQVRDLTPISSLEKLEDLYLDDNNITDLSPLSKLPILSRLRLIGNQITDIGPLSGLTQLRVLHIYNNQITNIEAIKNLNSLAELVIDENQIKDLSPCTYLTNLDVLSAKNNQIRDASPLQSLTELAHLDLSGNQITDIAPLANLEDLAFINLARNPIKDFSPLARLKDLKEIILDTDQIERLKPDKVFSRKVKIIEENSYNDETDDED